MNISRLEIPKSYDVNFIERIAQIKPLAWGFTPGLGTTNEIMFDASKTDAVINTIENYPALWLAEQKNRKLEALAAERRKYEIQGPNGLILDDKTIARLTAAAVGLMINTNRTEVTWEVSRGVFTTFPRAIVLGLAAAAVEHVQACFENVAAKTALIKAVSLGAGTSLEDALASLDAIDLTTNWPGN